VFGAETRGVNEDEDVGVAEGEGDGGGARDDGGGGLSGAADLVGRSLSLYFAK
jgi:hypothetical protein